SRDASDGEGTSEVSGRALNCRVEPVAPVTLDQVRDDFRVGLRTKAMSPRRQRLAKLAVVLDDPVADDGELGPAVGMRMRVMVRGPAVRRPPGVTDAQGATGPVGPEQSLEIGDFPSCLPDVQRPSGNGDNPGGVISPVLQPTKAGQDEGQRVP